MRIRIRRKRQKIQKLFLFTSTVYICFLLFAAVGSSYLTPYNPTTQNLNQRLLPPFTEGRILGTDDLGRDIWTRIVYGTRSLLVIGTVSVADCPCGGITDGYSGWSYRGGSWIASSCSLWMGFSPFPPCCWPLPWYPC